MRKLLVALLVVGLLAVAAPAMAQPSQYGAGSGDPLGLLASGAVVPYFGAGAASGAGGFSLLELYAPRWEANVHMFFYDVNCVRSGDSVNVSLTPNDVEIRRVDNIGGANPTQGLIAMANVDETGFNLVPWQTWSGVQARVWWVDVAGGFVRLIDPIAVDTWDGFVNAANFGAFFGGAWDSVGFYSPMRTAATFFAPLEAAPFATTIYFVCPNDNVIGSKASSGISTTRDFPALVPGARSSAAGPTPIRFRVFDDDENFLRDVSRTCICLDTKPVTSISNVYQNAVEAPVGTYTEVFGGTEAGSDPVCSTTEVVPATGSNPCPRLNNDPASPDFLFKYRLITPAVAAAGPYSFVAYRAIHVTGGLDVFGRAGGVARDAINDAFPAGVGGPWDFPFNTPNPANGR